MADPVTVLDNRDPMTTFLNELYDLGPVAWSAISLASRDRDAKQWLWDEAYEAALAGGGGWAAAVAARAAEEAGSGHRAAAMAAGAAAAVSAQHALTDQQYDLLFRPVGDVLPRAARARLQARVEQAVYTSCMPNTSRPLPA